MPISDYLYSYELLFQHMELSPDHQAASDHSDHHHHHHNDNVNDNGNVSNDSDADNEHSSSPSDSGETLSTPSPSSMGLSSIVERSDRDDYYYYESTDDESDDDESDGGGVRLDRRDVQMKAVREARFWPPPPEYKGVGVGGWQTPLSSEEWRRLVGEESGSGSESDEGTWERWWSASDEGDEDGYEADGEEEGDD